jgi:hypothetical protein
MLSLLGTIRSWIVSRRNRRDWIGSLRNDVTRNVALLSRRRFSVGLPSRNSWTCSHNESQSAPTAAAQAIPLL